MFVHKCQAILNNGFRIVVDKFLALASGHLEKPEAGSRKPESGIGTGIGTGTGSVTGIGRETYI